MVPEHIFRYQIFYSAQRKATSVPGGAALGAPVDDLRELAVDAVRLFDQAQARLTAPHRTTG